ncbi:hypothetical protein ISCGN_003266 [Ixodes scapularis]
MQTEEEGCRKSMQCVGKRRPEDRYGEPQVTKKEDLTADRGTTFKATRRAPRNGRKSSKFIQSACLQIDSPSSKPTSREKRQRVTFRNFTTNMRRNARETPVTKYLDDTIKRAIRGISDEDSEQDVLNNLVTARNPNVLHARRMGRSKSAVVLFKGQKVPFWIMYGKVEYKCNLDKKISKYARSGSRWISKSRKRSSSRQRVSWAGVTEHKASEKKSNEVKAQNDKFDEIVVMMRQLQEEKALRVMKMISEDEILEGLRASRVVAVKRIMTRRDGAEVRTKHLILTFERHTLPALVKAGYLNCRVRPYVPNPQRCFRCQRFGHGSRSCRGRETCAKCGSHDHVADVCEDPVACANCKGSHPAYSRSCPLWRQEKEILTLRAKENLSYPEAKQRFSFISKGTYSDAVRRGPAPRTESRATQFSLEDLAGPSQAPKQPAGKQGAPGNAGSTQTPQSIQARPPADRQPRASSSSQGGERGRRSNPSEAARLVSEQQGPPAAPSTSKDESVNVGGSRPGTSKTSSAGSGRGRKLVVQVSDHVGTGKPASKVQDAEGAVDIADSSAPSSDQEDMEWQTAKSKQKGKKPVVPP